MIERQRFDPDAGVVGTDDAVEALVDRLLRRWDADLRVAAVVDRDDLDVLALEAAVGVDLVGGQLGTVQHPLTQGLQIAR